MEPDFVYIATLKISKYGWEAECPECKWVYIVSEVHRKSECHLVQSWRRNKKQHSKKNKHYLRSDDAVVDPLVVNKYAKNFA